MSAAIRGMRGSIACVALVAMGVAACSGDDTASPLANDAAAGDAATSGDTGIVPSSDGSASLDAGRSSDVGVSPDGSHSSDGGPSPEGSASSDAGSSVGAGSSSDAGHTSVSDSSTLDATLHNDGGSPEADAAASPPAPVALCGALDTDFMLNEADASPTQATYDRTQWWVYSVNVNFFSSAGNDCRFANMLGSALTDSDGSTAAQDAYVNDLNTFTLQFMGCPLPTEAGALTYGLIPASLLSSHVFSSSDLQGLTQAYVDAITSTLQCGGPCPPNDGTLPNQAPDFSPMPSLSAGQLSAIRAQLDYLSSTVSGTVTSSTYTFNSCPPDAGTDAPATADDSSAAPADASADGG